MLLELEGGTGVPPVSRRYTWGLDLAGQNGEPSRDHEGATDGRGTAVSAVIEGAGG